MIPRSLAPLRWRRITLLVDGRQVVTEVPVLGAPEPEERAPESERGRREEVRGG